MFIITTRTLLIIFQNIKFDQHYSKNLGWWVGIDRKTLPMELAGGNCHARSVAGDKGSSVRTQIVSEPAIITLFGLDGKFHF
jgi:hypothetical protein